MNFYVVYTKNNKKILKYFKVNKIRRKVLIDIKQQMVENDIIDDRHYDYFNLIILAKIVQSLKKGRDIYYLPNFNGNFTLEQLLNIKEYIGNEINFNILMFYDEFRGEDNICNEVLSNLSKFDTSQIIKDY